MKIQLLNQVFFSTENETLQKQSNQQIQSFQIFYNSILEDHDFNDPKGRRKYIKRTKDSVRLNKKVLEEL